MLRLLNIEFIKLWNNRSSKFLIFCYFGLLISIALFASIKFNIGPIKFHLADMGIFSFPYIWHFNTFVAALFKLFLAIVIVSMVANEYSNKTLKQNLIDGLSKKEFLASKFLTVVVFSVISTLFVFVVSLILGLIFSDYNEIPIIFSDLEYLIAYLVKLIGFFSFCLFIGILIKRSAFALGFLFIWFLVVEIFPYLYVMSKYSKDLADKIFAFFPFGSMWNLIDEPGSRLNAVQSLANQVGEDISYDYAVHWYEIVIVLVWTVIFVRLSYWLLKKRDL
ncbi:ABC transporter permease [Aquimarina sp. D1M17]|uniref:ABC transporter permease n=1 Tax=Aquimarina acroporae TaxID=2937283 RepID=UPI0020C14D5D|nr:ABC transporter permease [Aquimarina acroporae]MCK8522098.1 ABC transporter permease [Aquimarina acroporae]